MIPLWITSLVENVPPFSQECPPTTCLLFKLPETAPLLILASHVAHFRHGDYCYVQLPLALVARHRYKHGGAHYQGSETTCSPVS